MNFVSDKLINLKSKLPQTPFSPTYNYFIFENNIDNQIDIKQILNVMFDREKELINFDYSPTNDVLFEEKNLPIRYKFFNKKIFDLECVQTLIYALKNNIQTYSKSLHQSVPEKLWIQIWCNILRKNQLIELHQHDASENSYISGNLCLQSNNTKTHFLNPQSYFNTNKPEYSSVNEKGKLTLFPSTLPHGTDKVQNDEPRVTIAFDILTEKNIKTITWRDNKNYFFKENVIEL